MANYVLEILDGDRAGEVLPVPDRALRIGRKPSNDLVLADEKTSGVHAEVVLEGDRHVLRDLGSTNGTFLDGKRVTEVVLTSGDVVTVGRLRVKFREEGDAAAAGTEGDFAVHRLDAARVQKRGGSMALLGVLLLVGAGVGGYLWWSSRDAGQGDTAGLVTTQKKVLVVAGNKLDQKVGSCEDDSLWKLAAHGLGWQPSGSASTGKGGLEAVRIPDDATDFAIATPAESLTVFSGRSLSIAAFVRTTGTAQVAVRAVFSNSNADAQDGGALRFRTGSRLQSAADWTRVDFEVGVPSGCDRLDVEVLAVLPDAEAAAYVDDVAVTEGGSGKPFEYRIEEGAQTVVGTRTAFATFSSEPTLLGVAPGTVPAALARLHAAALCVLSDVGAELAVTPEPRSLKIAVTGQDDLEFVFPADSAGGTMARPAADAAFAAVAAESEYSAAQILLGGPRTRALLALEAAVPCSGRVGGGLYRLRVGAARCDLVLGFLSERQTALGLLREATAADAANEPGRALDLLLELQRKVPQDPEALNQAVTTRSQIFARLDEAIGKLQSEYGEAEFFDTRGGFERVVAGVDRLFQLYGENNLEGRALAAQLRADAMARLTAIDGEKAAALGQRFDQLAQAFRDAGQTGLADLVQDYKKRNLGK